MHDVVLPVVRSNSLGYWFEEPLLGSNILSPSLEGDLACTNALSNSLHWKSGSEIEWSVDMESEFRVESLFGNLSCFINIDYIPFLVSLSDVVPDTNCLTFDIFS